MMTRIFLLAALSFWPGAAQAASELPSPYPYPEPAWSPYLVGALVGVLTMFTLAISKKPVGASSAYSDLAGMLALIRQSPRFLRSGGHLLFAQSGMANFAATARELTGAGFYFTTVHETRGVFRDHYFEEPHFI